jgi:glycolate oxidase FAD binding subunit
MPAPVPIQRPTTPEDLATAVRAAAQAGAQVKIEGTNSLPLTRFDAARPLQPLSTIRMNKLLHHAVEDMTVCVHAGITLEALQRQLAWRNQWLPVDPPVIASPGRSPGTRTLGGLIASNSLGPLRFALESGDWRRLILGIRWIDANGELIKGGGQTVKNVAGYSSPRMLIGSAGSLGIIAEVTLRTFARPPDEQSLFFFTSSAAQAEELLAAVYTAPTTPAYIEMIAPRTFVGNPLQLPAAADAGPVLVVGFIGRPEVCSAQIRILRDLPAAKELESIAQTAPQSGRLRLWLTSEPPIDAAANDAVGIRLHVSSSQVAHLLCVLEAQAPGSWLVAEGQGILRGTLRTPNRSPLALLKELAPDAPLLVTQGPAPDPNSDPLATRLKNTLDPQNTFGQSPH